MKQRMPQPCWLGVLIAGVVLLAVPRPANALVSPSPDPDTWQVNGRVTAIAYLGDTVYVGGSFSAVRPARTVPGDLRERTRRNLAAFNATSGALLNWNPDANGSVRVLRVSPAGTRIYVGGSFTRVGGAARYRVAAVGPISGAALNWKPYVNDTVKAITTSNSGAHVYLGGDFTSVAGAGRSRLASIEAGSGKLSSVFKPSVTRDTRFATVLGLDVSNSGKTLYLVGLFTRVKGVGRHNSAAVSTGIATLRPWKPAKALATATSVEVSAGGTRVFVGGRGPGGYVQSYTTGSAGTPVWAHTANGDVEALVASSGTLYVGGHFTSMVGIPRGHLAAMGPASGSLLSWNPNANGVLGVYGAGLRGSRVGVGGQFTRVAGVDHQGFAQFSGTP